MQQRDITVPQVATGAGYSFLYSLYLHCVAWLLRKAVAFLTGDGSSFTKHLFVDTPGLGEGRVRCSICLPSNDERRPKLLPLILVMEGGGFVLGQPTDGEQNDRYLSEKLNAVVLSIDYAKSPRYPFPHALLQLYQVLRWSLSSPASDELGVAIDPSRVVFMGNSAGGNLTAALSLLTAFTSGPCKVFRAGLPNNYRQVMQILLYPSTACNELYRRRLMTASPEVQAQSLPIWIAELMEASYLPPTINKRQIFVAPLVAELNLLRELQPQIAPVSCYLAGMDCLKDEGLQYCRLLESAKVGVKVKEYPNAIHGFSHYQEGNKGFSKDDVNDCWQDILNVLAQAFGTVPS